jgi:hypothetical protein
MVGVDDMIAGLQAAGMTVAGKSCSKTCLPRP